MKKLTLSIALLSALSIGVAHAAAEPKTLEEKMAMFEQSTTPAIPLKPAKLRRTGGKVRFQPVKRVGATQASSVAAELQAIRGRGLQAPAGLAAVYGGEAPTTTTTSDAPTPGRVAVPAGLAGLQFGGRRPAAAPAAPAAAQPGRLGAAAGGGLAGLFGGGGRGGSRAAAIRAKSELDAAKQEIADKYGISVEDLN